MTEPGKIKRLKWHYLDRDRQSHGGFSTEDFIDKIYSGELNSRSYIWNGKTITQWQRVEKVLDKLADVGVDTSRIVMRQKYRGRSSTVGGNHPVPQKENAEDKVPEKRNEEFNTITPVRDSDAWVAEVTQNGAVPFYFQSTPQTQPAPVQTRVEPAYSMPEARAEPAYTISEARVEPAYHTQEKKTEPAYQVQETRAEPAYQVREIITEPVNPYAMQESRAEPSTYGVQQARIEPAYVEPKPQITPQPVVQDSLSPVNNDPKPIKIEYEGVALVIASCVTYGTIMGDITFDRAKKTCMFDMNFNPVHSEAPAAHHTQLMFVWNPKTYQLVHAVESGDPMWEGTCVDVGNAFHIRNREGVDITMVPSSTEKLDPRITEFRSTYVGLALGVEQATFWGTYYGDITFNIPNRRIKFEMAFESSFKDQIKNHKQSLDFSWDPVKGEVDDEKNQFYGRCAGVGNCFHLRNSYAMDIIFLRQIPGDPEPDEVYQNNEAAIADQNEGVAAPIVQPNVVQNQVKDPEPVNAIESVVSTPGETQQKMVEPEAMPMNDRSESEGTARLRSRIEAKNESEALLQRQVEELAGKLNEQIMLQQQKDRQRDEEIRQLNLQWTQKAENLRTAAMEEAERQFQQDREQSQRLIQGMQERLGHLESTITREQKERSQIEQQLEDRRKETQSLQAKMKTLEDEKLRIEAQKAKMQEALEKNTRIIAWYRQNLEIEQLREELSRSRGNTPKREFAPVQSSGFSLMGGKPLRNSTPVLKPSKLMKNSGFGLGFKQQPAMGFSKPQEKQQTQASFGDERPMSISRPVSRQVISKSAEPEGRAESKIHDPATLNVGFGGGVSKSAEPSPVTRDYAGGYHAPARASPGRMQPTMQQQVRPSRTPDTNEPVARNPHTVNFPTTLSHTNPPFESNFPEPSAGTHLPQPVPDREAFIRSMAQQIKNNRKNSSNYVHE